MVRSIFATLGLMTTLLVGGIAAAPPAAASCNADLTKCSQIKDADNSSGRILVYCQHNGWAGSYFIYPGQQSGCGRYAYSFEVYWPYSVWCRPLGQNVAYTYWGGPGRYSITGNGSINCLIA